MLLSGQLDQGDQERNSGSLEDTCLRAELESCSYQLFLLLCISTSVPLLEMLMLLLQRLSPCCHSRAALGSECTARDDEDTRPCPHGTAQHSSEEMWHISTRIWCKTQIGPRFKSINPVQNPNRIYKHSFKQGPLHIQDVFIHLCEV